MSYAVRDEEARDFIRRLVHQNTASLDDIAEEAADAFEIDLDEAGELTDELEDERWEATATWPAVTDCDRLDRAFAALESEGVIARQHFACCNTCGHVEIGHEVNEALRNRRKIDGYVFYHRQDTDEAYDDHLLRLRYAGVTWRPDATREVGERVVAALRAQGLDVSWDGDAHRTIEVTGFT